MIGLLKKLYFTHHGDQSGETKQEQQPPKPGDDDNGYERDLRLLQKEYHE